MRRPLSTLAIPVLLVAQAATAQVARSRPGIPLELAALQRQALDADPRVREFSLDDEQAALRVRNIEAERLPTVSALGQTQYQSDVPRAPFTLPGGQALFSPPKGSYDVSMRVDERLFDPTRPTRSALARSDVEAGKARLRTGLFAIREEVNDAFFTAALLDRQIGALAATLQDLDGRSRDISARVREGTALAAEGAILDAAILTYRQQDDELRAGRGAALARLASLTRQPVPPDAEMALPDLGDAVAAARTGLDGLRARPEYEQFARTRDQVSRRQDLAAASERPQLSAFGRAGYGKPGLNFISDELETYAVAGLQLQWKGWTWGSSARERQALGLERAAVSAEEDAFTDRLHRAAATTLSTIDRLAATLALDDRIVALRQSVDAVTRIRLGEHAVTTAEYLDRHAELLTAQFNQARHRVELAQARAGLLTMLGLEVR